MKVKVLVLKGYGLNSEMETACAFEKSGAEVVEAHINSLIDGDVLLEDFQILVFPGGSTWGDEHGAALIQAAKIRHFLGESIERFILNDRLVLGIANGFQMLVNAGFLPAFDSDYNKRSLAFLPNENACFVNKWVDLSLNSESPCVFTRDMDLSLFLPIRQAEGRLYASEESLDKLKLNKQIVLRYKEGSIRPLPSFNSGEVISDIAGICDLSGRVFGIMAHPETCIHYTNYPGWTAMTLSEREYIKKMNPALNIFKNAVNCF